MDGLLVIDKPAGITSRDVVDRALGWFPRKTRVGHSGTLDPLATGVLVLCAGVATRLAEYVQDQEKVYRTEIILGATSTTDDAEGVIEPVPAAAMPSAAAISDALSAFVGTIDQVPPIFSASKVDGRRAYDLARKGKAVTLDARQVQIYQIDILDYVYPKLRLEVRCGKGTYIRSLARDLGSRLGTGAYIASLRRTRVGVFRVEDAISIDAHAEEARKGLLPLSAAVAHLPRVTLDAEKAKKLCHGQPIPWETGQSGLCAVFEEPEVFIAVAELDREKKCLLPAKVLPAS